MPIARGISHGPPSQVLTHLDAAQPRVIRRGPDVRADGCLQMTRKTPSAYLQARVLLEAGPQTWKLYGPEVEVLPLATAAIGTSSAKLGLEIMALRFRSKDCPITSP
ncbi:hypothetical protein AVEN_196339-1 [Araneus ventricosus]|uniref:Uncharacterized protein n=1 Tax=Araneus ventricosus TaxID=182803 RepID=A0A4Y2ATW8_ARAVE|nr:hypothetical protein AVEN_196339-1 [Araneus ventricosus]